MFFSLFGNFPSLFSPRPDSHNPLPHFFLRPPLFYVFFLFFFKRTPPFLVTSSHGTSFSDEFFGFARFFSFIIRSFGLLISPPQFFFDPFPFSSPCGLYSPWFSCFPNKVLAFSFSLNSYSPSRWCFSSSI